MDVRDPVDEIRAGRCGHLHLFGPDPWGNVQDKSVLRGQESRDFPRLRGVIFHSSTQRPWVQPKSSSLFLDSTANTRTLCDQERDDALFLRALFLPSPHSEQIMASGRSPSEQPRSPLPPPGPVSSSTPATPH